MSYYLKRKTVPVEESQKLKEQATEKVMSRIEAELKRAQAKYPDHPSLEHSLCVIIEEVDELKREVFLRGEYRRPHRIWEEAVQLAAMSIRLLVEMESRRTCTNEHTKKVRDFG